MERVPTHLPDKRDEIAAAWVEKLTAGRPGDADIAALRAWVAADPANRVAYERARAVWAALPAAGLKAPRRGRTYALGGALAASLLLALTLAWPGHDYATASGDLAEYRLPDGTTVWLDSDSAIDVAMDARARTVTLARGRAAFAVAKNMRPFAVRAGDTTIRDIGTDFTVDREEKLTVAVREGEVEVARGAERTRLRAGEGARFDAAVERIGAAPDAFAWRDRRILLDRKPLGEALAELDRYYPGRILLTDDGLASKPVSGTLFSDKPEEGLETLARSQHLSITRYPWLTLVGRADPQDGS